MEAQNTIQLSGAAGVSHVVDFHSRALEAIQAGHDVVFDFGDARDFDASILQLLMASTNAVNDCDAKVLVQNVDQDIARSFEKHGAGELVSDALNCDNEKNLE